MKTLKKIIYTLLGLLLAGTVALIAVILFAEYSGKRFEAGSSSKILYPDDESRLAYNEDGSLEELPGIVPSENTEEINADNSAAEETPADTIADSPQDASAEEEHTYILNKESVIFHYETCSDVQNISEDNRLTMTSTRDMVMGRGYQPCQNCNP